jgi:hypothetical protein
LLDNIYKSENAEGNKERVDEEGAGKEKRKRRRIRKKGTNAK